MTTLSSRLAARLVDQMIDYGKKQAKNGMLICLSMLVASCARSGDHDQARNSLGSGSYEILFLGDTSHGESYHAKYEAEGKGNIIKEKGYDYSFARQRNGIYGRKLFAAGLIVWRFLIGFWRGF